MYMQNQCTGGQCSTGMTRGCEGNMGACGMGQCASGYGYKTEKDKMTELMETVKCAKESLLKEKIKARLEARIGKKLDKIADVAVEMLMNKWKMKHEKYEMKEAMMEKMEDIMSEGKKD